MDVPSAFMSANIRFLPPPPRVPSLNQPLPPFVYDNFSFLDEWICKYASSTDECDLLRKISPHHL